MPPVGFEPTTSAGERPQTYALDRAATGTGFMAELITVIYWASFYRYQSLYVFIEMAELLDFPVIKKATPLIYVLINGLINLLS